MKSSKKKPGIDSKQGSIPGRDLMNDMRFELIAIAKIKPAAYNPRKDLQPDDEEYQAIKDSIATHGMVDPLVWNEVTGNLVGGHQRLKILINEFHIKKAWCSVVTIKDPEMEAALNVKLNKLSGEFDFPRLRVMFDQFGLTSETAPRFGFTALEFQKLMTPINDLTGGAPDSFNKAEFLVVVECKDEAQQNTLWKDLQKRGYACKLIG